MFSHAEGPRLIRAFTRTGTRTLILTVCVLVACVSGSVVIAGPSGSSVLRWAGDAEGGAPFVEADPTEPRRVVGFDVDVAQLIARALAREPQFVQIGFASIDQSIARGDADLGLSGVEDTPARRAALLTTYPYYEFQEVLSVRAADSARFANLQDLAGRRIGTLGGTMAYELLLRVAPTWGIEPLSYDDDVHPFEDLRLGRVDAVLLDDVLAARRARQIAGIAIQPAAVATGHYVGVLARDQAELRDRANAALLRGMRDGSLEAIFRKWGVWNERQSRLYARVQAGADVPAMESSTPGLSAAESQWDATARYLPALFRASGVTILLTCFSMAVAVAVGVTIASLRVYGPGPLRIALAAYVEVVRGTPVLLQLFVLYYGIASVVRLPAFAAAILGLGLNYAAYESEIYRAALEAVSLGQIEAARVLGFSEMQILRLIRGPQALRLALAPMTNDFVALLKDSSLVSVLTVMELTKQTQIFATNIGSWVVPGVLCAAMYLALSLPLSVAARRLERRWRVAA